MGRLNVMDTSPLFHSQLGFIYRQFRYRIPAFTPSNSPPASSRTVLLTGFTSGLGFQASLHLLRAGTNLILVARNPERCEFGLKKIRDAIGKEVDIDAVVDETTGRRRVYTMCCDQTELADVVRFGKELKMKLENGEIGGGLDAAVLNAGVSLTGWDVTKDGWERALQVNLLSTSLLQLLILPLLRQHSHATPSTPRLIVVNSDSSCWWKIRQLSSPNILQAFNDPSQINKTRRYPRIKALLLLFTMELWRHEVEAHTPSGAASSATSSASPSGSEKESEPKSPDVDATEVKDTHSGGGGGDKRKIVNIISITPGLCNTEILDYLPPGLQAPTKKLGWPAEDGGRALANAAVGDEAESWGGEFVVSGRVRSSPGKLMRGKRGLVNREKVYKQVMAHFKKQFPEVVEGYEIPN